MGRRDETVCIFSPDAHYMSIPGLVYGGMIASLIDCHSIGSAAAFAYRAEGRAMDSEPPIRFLTASLHVDYLKHTPMGIPLVLRSQLKEFKGRKMIVTTTLAACDVICARDEVVAVRVPDDLANRALTA